MDFQYQFCYMQRKIIGIGFLVIFLWFLCLNFGFVKDSYALIRRVPHDYRTIQEAIDAADPSDTILVASGVYNECLAVDKPLSIIGEAPETTIVDGGGYNWTKTSICLLIISSNVLVDGFTFRNSTKGICTESSTNITITSNILTINYEGINLNNSYSLIVVNNTVESNAYGIQVTSSSNCIIQDNFLANNFGGDINLSYGGGIFLGGSSNNTIKGNHLTKNLEAIFVAGDNNTIIENEMKENAVDGIGLEIGIKLYCSKGNILANNTIISDAVILSSSSFNMIRNNNVTGGGGIGAIWGLNNTFFGNVISCNRAGIHIEDTCDFFVGNLIMNNTEGIVIHYCNGSTFYHNILTNNTIHAPKDVYPNVNTWDNGHEGNYWSNYTGTDSDMDAIGDSPHVLYELNTDRYPLMAPINFFDVGTWNDTQQQVNIISNSTITNFQLNSTKNRISFNVTGETPTIGFCRITIPNAITQDLWNNNYTVLIDTTEPIFQKNWTDTTNTHIYIIYQHSEHEIIIIPEFSSHMLLPLLTLSTLTAIFLKKRLRD